MKRFFAMTLVGAGVLLVALGLLFVIGAGGKDYRYAVGGIGLLLGLGTVIAGVLVHRRADAESPHRLEAEILELARRQSGEISEANVGAALGARASLSGPIMEGLVRRGMCRREERDGRSWLIFEDLVPRLVIRRCAYCAFEAPISDPSPECPKCGGPLETVRSGQRDAPGDGLYGMDG